MRSSIPKRRWLQFSLRTLLVVVTIAAMSLGWWRHRSYCLERADSHQMSQLVCIVGTIDPGAGRWEDELPPRPVDLVRFAETERLTKLADRHGEAVEAYRHAVWQPWLRWSINEPPIEVESEQPPSQ